MKFEVSSSADASDIEMIVAGLTEHAVGAGIEARNTQPLFVLGRTDQGQLIGGLAATTVWGWLRIKELWISAGRRDHGLGTEIVRKAEDEARRRGCHHAFLDTFDFQARPFYEKLGYHEFGRLDEFPTGHCRFFLMKQL